MTDPVVIPLKPGWDAVATYDSLGEAPEAIFVGRDTLLAPLVTEISDPDKRGTYLISGYRGTGKTTLLIEALRRGREHLERRGQRLFPLILNVSEVAASLTDKPEDDHLKIDPNRLLVALLRAIDQRLGPLVREDDSLSELAGTAHAAYRKATAAKFVQSASEAVSRERLRIREVALSPPGRDLLKTGAIMAGAGAAALEIIAVTGPALGWLHAAAAALAVLAGTFAFNVKRTTTESAKTSSEISFEHDNSLQQLETDLKDLLQELKDKGLRTVVVLEELDKIVDPNGHQLDKVIRYFKNLFTQAPALFFFVTDKQYFDIIASAIKHARRKGTYAVEHTFFTHRIFVGRPTTEECLSYISEIALLPQHREAIGSVAETLGKPGRIAEADELGRFIRVVMYNAANHMFDLKNQIRRFARHVESPDHGTGASLVIDSQTLTEEEASMAVFQDLILEKCRSFEIKGGRTYANEVLISSLFTVFNQFGSSAEQQIPHFGQSDTDEDGLLLDEQLDSAEVKRVLRAVHSLLDDLERGRALNKEPLSPTYTWRPDAARAFRYVRQPQKHEEELIAQLNRFSALVAALYPSEDPVTVDLPDFAGRIKQLSEAPEPLPADAASGELYDALDMYVRAVEPVFHHLLEQLRTYGFNFMQVASGLGGSLHLALPSSGDPRISPVSPRGAVLLAIGEYESLPEDVRSFIAPTGSFLPIDNLALVHVIHGIDASEPSKRRADWLKFLTARAGPSDILKVSVAVHQLVPPEATAIKLTAVEMVAANLAAFGAWARRHNRPLYVPGEMPDLTEILRGWDDGDTPLLVIPDTPAGMRMFDESEVLESSGRPLLSLHALHPDDDAFGQIALQCMMNGFDTAAGEPERWSPIGLWLVSSGRVIVFSGILPASDKTAASIKEVIDAGGKAILISPDESLPEPLGSVPATVVPRTRK